MMRYEPHIDGLRAIAVVSVIIYHANFTLFGGNAIQSGYLGVDVFFVISGYLITALLLSENAKSGRIDLLSFLARRVRRIFPALVFIIIACIPFVVFISNETQAVEFRNAALSSLVGGSNLYFWWATTDYDAGNSQLLPLLHTWSLGVELQFYAVFPVLFAMFLRLSRRSLWLFVLSSFAASLACAQLLSARNPELSFFLSPTRFWEMLTGSIAAILMAEIRTSNSSERARAIISSIALAVLLCSFFLPVSGLGHPGLATLPTVFATAALLTTGGSKGPVFRLLTLRPMVWTGKVSYSAYLWHFPLFAFSRQVLVEPDLLTKLLLILLTFGLSALSYRLIERPYRDVKQVDNAVASRRFAFSSALAALLVSALSAQPLNSAIPKLLDPINGHIKASFDVRNMHRVAQEMSVQRTAFQRTELTNVLIIGNSHSRNIFNAFEQNRHLWPNAEFLRFQMQLVCFDASRTTDRTFADSLLRSDEFKKADVIVIATRYRHRRTCNGMTAPWTTEDKGVSELLRVSKSAGKRMIVFGPIPEFGGGDVDLAIYKPLRTNLIVGRRSMLETDAEFSRKVVERINQAAFRRVIDLGEIAQSIRSIAHSFGAEYVDQASFVCNESKAACSAMTDRAERAYADNNHLTIEGSLELGEKLARAGLPEALRDTME